MKRLFYLSIVCFTVFICGCRTEDSSPRLLFIDCSTGSIYPLQGGKGQTGDIMRPGIIIPEKLSVETAPEYDAEVSGKKTPQGH